MFTVQCALHLGLHAFKAGSCGGMPPCLYLQLDMAGVMQAEVAAVGQYMDVKLFEACMCLAKFLFGIKLYATVLVLAGGRGGGHTRAGGGRGPARGRQAARGGGCGRARHHAPSRADAGTWLGQPPARVNGKSCQAPAVLVFCRQQGKPARVLLQCQAGYPDSVSVLEILFGQRWCPSAQSKECRPGQVNAAFVLVLHTGPQ